jgi:hypothetical protein
METLLLTGLELDGQLSRLKKKQRKRSKLWPMLRYVVHLDISLLSHATDICFMGFLQIGEYKLILSKQDKPLEKQIRAAPSTTSTTERLKKDLEIVESIVEYLERGQAEEEKKGSEIIREMRAGWEKESAEKQEQTGDATKDETEIVSLSFLSLRHRPVTD